MINILGYGEDSLTLWALSTKLETLLEKINENSNDSNHIIFYRPSFGRGKPLKEPTDTKAEFGEFDAILISPKSWYLIESKWDNLRVQKRVTINLSPVQILRHNLFTWYFNNWQVNNNYEQFYDSYEKIFPEKFLKKQRKIAPKNSLLSKNLEFILGKKSTNNIKNVFLYFHQDHYEPTITVNTEKTSFLTIKMGYPVNENSNFIELSR